MLIRYIGHSCIYIETPNTKLLIDPWLTERLDRLWVHWPPLDQDSIDRSLDVNLIMLTHHHFDHHHFPSLQKLPKKACVLYPELEKSPKISGSGMGHKVIPYTLRRLGFEKIYPLKNFNEYKIQDLTIRAFPSKVDFPEQSFLIENKNSRVLFCGDCMLHQDTIDFFENYKEKINIAFIPIHSISPPKPLTIRQHEDDYLKYLDIAKERFAKYADVINAEYTVPSALGWKINCLEKDNLQWANHLLFPLTTDQATSAINNKHKLLFMGPGDEYILETNNLVTKKSKYAEQVKIKSYSQDISLLVHTPIPRFSPVYNTKRTYNNEALLQNVINELEGTDYWLRALEKNRKFSMRITNDYDDDSFMVDIVKGKIEKLDENELETLPFTWIHSGILCDLLDSKLLIENSYGLWVSNDMLLSSIFHKPKYYIKHLNNWLEEEIER